jgi:hypothetical protein
MYKKSGHFRLAKRPLYYFCCALLYRAGVPSPANIRFRAAEMAMTLGIPCPMINSGLWLRRFVDELDLTEVYIKPVSQYLSRSAKD